MKKIILLTIVLTFMSLHVYGQLKFEEKDIIFYYQKKLSQLTTIKKNISKQRMQGEIKEKKINILKTIAFLKLSFFEKLKIIFKLI